MVIEQHERLHQLHRVEGEAIPLYSWPDIPDDVLDTARALAYQVSAARRDQEEKASVRSEERLAQLVPELVERAIERPAEHGLHAESARRLREDAAFMVQVVKGVKVLASWLYPLSRLLYLLDGVEDIHINHWDEWIVTSRGRKALLGKWGNPFTDEEKLLTFLKEKVLAIPGFKGQRQLSEGHPVALGNLGRVMRVCVVQEPAVSGPTTFVACLRLQSTVRMFTLDQYVHEGGMPAGVARFLRSAVAARASVIISGGTSSGKTTLLRVLCGLVPKFEQLLVIEDSPELSLHDRGDGEPWHPHAQSICTVPPTTMNESGITMRDLVKVALRLRPGRIILGEARGGEMVDVCQAASTGHEGSMVTIHADDSRHAIKRAAEYVLEAADYAGIANADHLAMSRVHQAFDLVVHVQEKDGVRRVVGVTALGEDVSQTKDVYVSDPASGHLRREMRMVGDLPSNLRFRLHSELGTEIPYVE